MMTIEEVTKWVSTAKKGQETMYYKGFFAEDSFRSLEMRKFSKNLLDLEKKTDLFILYQKKIEEGDQSKQPIYDYCIQKIKTEGNK
tara:strand:+ start:213 stop:470 length:258 start_codon:yes stop_codon:yes gene_type:complete